MTSINRLIARLAAAVSLVLWTAGAGAAGLKIEITGVDRAQTANVRAFLSVTALEKTEFSEIDLRRAHQRAAAEVRNALQPFGYYEPQLRSTLVKESKHWRARYEIDKGRPTKVTALNLTLAGEGEGDPALLAVVAGTKLAAGKRLIHSEYENTKTRLLQSAYDEGYLDAALDQAEIRVNPGRAEAEINLALSTGRRWQFGSVTIEQDILRPEFVQRFVPFSAGEHFDADRLTRLQLDLSDSDYFSRVEIETRRPESTDPDVAPQMAVVVRTEPNKPRKYLLSAGYGTDTGPRLGLGLEMRRLNTRGHKFRSDLRLSSLQQSLTARYVVPVKQVNRDRVVFGATLRREDLGDTESEAGVVFAALEDNWFGVRRRLYLNLERETYDITGDNSQSSDMLYTGVTLTYSNVDDILRTRRGYGLNFDIRGGSDALVSSVDFLQSSATANIVYPLAAKTRFLARARIAATKVSDFDQLPPSLRFFTGGDRTVRGYGYQSISPENTAGDDIGGRYLLESRIEIEQLLYRDYGVALFYDAGDATNADEFSLSRGIGIGLRWLSPVGTIRADIAHPLDDDNTSFRFHFSLGADIQ